jgi:hypothetical protein
MTRDLRAAPDLARDVHRYGRADGTGRRPWTDTRTWRVARMSFLDNLFGAGQKQQEYRDFADRYQQGKPWEGYSDQEVMERYNEVAPNLSPDAYEDSAAEAFARLSPQERQEFARYLRQRARQSQAQFPDMDDDDRYDRYEDPRELARATARMERQQPGLLGGLLGGGQGVQQALDNPLAKAALAGIAAIAAQKIMGGGIGFGGRSAAQSDATSRDMI